MEKCHTRNNGRIKYEIPLIIYKGEQFMEYKTCVTFECIHFLQTYARLKLRRIPFDIIHIRLYTIVYVLYVLVMQQPITKDQF